MMRVAALSDLHGNLDVRVPACDLLLIAGDVCPWRYGSTTLDQAQWLRKHFIPWLLRQQVPQTILVWGNHDWVGQRSPHLVPDIPLCDVLTDDVFRFVRIGRIGRDDRVTRVEEVIIYGTPWQLPFFDWAFNLCEQELERKWQAIPCDTDILVCHGPPQGYGDQASRGLRVGSSSLLARIKEVKPRLVVFGHIHEDWGRWTLEHSDGKKTDLANVSLVNAHYELVREPQIFEVGS